MENLFLVIIALAASYYLYVKIYKNKGCNCGDGSCCDDKKETIKK